MLKYPRILWQVTNDIPKNSPAYRLAPINHTAIGQPFAAGCSD